MEDVYLLALRFMKPIWWNFNNHKGSPAVAAAAESSEQPRECEDSQRCTEGDAEARLPDFG